MCHRQGLMQLQIIAEGWEDQTVHEQESVGIRCILQLMFKRRLLLASETIGGGGCWESWGAPLLSALITHVPQTYIPGHA